LISCNRFPARSGDIKLSPVMLASGRARFETSPLPTGSPAVVITIGIVWLPVWPQAAPGFRLP
jgi:hypothetical protein